MAAAASRGEDMSCNREGVNERGSAAAGAVKLWRNNVGQALLLVLQLVLSVFMNFIFFS
jgi:hypothetical protein